MIQSTTTKYQSYWPTSVLVRVLLIWYSHLLSQYQNYWYDNPPLPHHQSYWYPPVYFYLSVVFSPRDTTQYTTAPVPFLHTCIRYSTFLLQHQFYWYDTVHDSPFTKKVRESLLILHSPWLSQYLSYWYDTFHQYPCTSQTDTTQPTIIPVLILLIWYNLPLSPDQVILIRLSSLLPHFQSYLYDKVQFCPQDLLIWHSTEMSHCQPYWYYTVHNSPSFNLTDIIQSTYTPVPVLLIRHRLLFPYQS